MARIIVSCISFWLLSRGQKQELNKQTFDRCRCLHLLATMGESYRHKQLFHANSTLYDDERFGHDAEMVETESREFPTAPYVVLPGGTNIILEIKSIIF